MSSAGAQSNHINHVQTQMQYAAIVGADCVIGYVVAAISRSWIVALGVSAAILVLVLVALKKFVSDKAPANA